MQVSIPYLLFLVFLGLAGTAIGLLWPPAKRHEAREQIDSSEDWLRSILAKEEPSHPSLPNPIRFAAANSQDARAANQRIKRGLGELRV